MEDRYQDKILKERFDQLEVTPPAHVWHGVEAGLNKASRVMWPKRLFMVASIACLTALASFLWVMKGQLDSEGDSLQASKIRVSSLKNIILPPERSYPESTHIARAGEQEDTVVVVYPSSIKEETTASLVPLKGEKDLLLKEANSKKIIPLVFKSLDRVNLVAPLGKLKELKKTSPIAFSYNTAALERAPKKSEANIWSVEAHVSPIVNGAQSSSSSQYKMVQGNASNTAAIGGGIAFGCKLGHSRWGIRTGLNYNRSGQRTQYEGVNMFSMSGISQGILGRDQLMSMDKLEKNWDVQRIFSKAGIVVMKKVAIKPSETIEYEPIGSVQRTASPNYLKQDFEFLEVPLEVTYDLLRKGIRLQLTGGMSAHYLFKHNTQVETFDHQVLPAETTGLRDFSYTGNLGLGVGYELLPRFLLRVEPSMRYFINSLSSNDHIEYRPYSFGVFTGITYTFK